MSHKRNQQQQQQCLRDYNSTPQLDRPVASASKSSDIAQPKPATKEANLGDSINFKRIPASNQQDPPSYSSPAINAEANAYQQSEEEQEQEQPQDSISYQNFNRRDRDSNQSAVYSNRDGAVSKPASPQNARRTKKAVKKQNSKGSSNEKSYQFQSLNHSKDDHSLNQDYDAKRSKKYVKSNTKGSQGRMSRTSNEKNIVHKDDQVIKKYNTQMGIQQDEDIGSQKSSQNQIHKARKDHSSTQRKSFEPKGIQQNNQDKQKKEELTEMTKTPERKIKHMQPSKSDMKALHVQQFNESQRISKLTEQTEISEKKFKKKRGMCKSPDKNFQSADNSEDQIVNSNMKNRKQLFGKSIQNQKEPESYDKISKGSKMSTQSKLSFHSSIQRFKFNNNLVNQMNKSEQIEYFKMQGLQNHTEKNSVYNGQNSAEIGADRKSISMNKIGKGQDQRQSINKNLYSNDRSHIEEENKQYQDIRVFRDRKDVIGELILYENAFFGEYNQNNQNVFVLEDQEKQGESDQDNSQLQFNDEIEDMAKAKRFAEISQVNKCDYTVASQEKSHFQFGDILQDLSPPAGKRKNGGNTTQQNVEMIESKIFFANCNNRFQYFQRVFTHHSINKYLVVKNLKQLINERENNDAENMAGPGQILQGMTVYNEMHTQGGQQDQTIPNNNNNSILNKLQLSMGFGANQHGVDQNAIQTVAPVPDSKDIRQSAFQLTLPIYKLAMSQNNSLIQKEGNQQITDQNEKPAQNAQIVPVYTEKEDIQLRDYIPYIGQEAIGSDNSGDYEDDFSLAPTIILTDGNDQNSFFRRNLNEPDSFGRMGTYTKSSLENQQTPNVDDDYVDDVNRQETPIEELLADKDKRQQIETIIKRMKMNAKEIKFTAAEIPNILIISQGDISNIVYQEIKRAPPFSKIILPDRHLILPQIYIKHPLAIKGSSGTILEIVNGNFICDFRQFINRHFNGVSPKHHRDFRCLLQEVNIVFKFDPIRIFERLKESQQKLNFNRDKVSYSEVCLQYFKVDRNVIQLPMIVVENCTALDVNDCYFRSIKREQHKNEGQNFSGQQKKQNAKNQSKNSPLDDKIMQPKGNTIFGQNVLNLEQKTYDMGKDFTIGGQANQTYAQQNQLMSTQPRDFAIEEIGFWVNGDYMFNHQLNMSEMINCENNESDLRISSSIFYNFYDQIRAGLNTKILIEKCHFSECRNNSIYLINPCSALIRNNSITRAGHNAILCEWLVHSNWVEKTRQLQIINNEIQMSNENGIFICSQDEKFSAHNLKILVSDNIIKKNGMTGLRVSNLIINDMQISTNDFYKNEYGAVKLTQVHQKSNKNKFVLRECNLTDTTYSSGLILKDVGLLIQGCRIERNSEDGINIDSSFYPKPAKTLQPEVKQFLKRQPMQVVINECEVSFNSKNGIYIQDFWKGPVEISDCMIVSNQEYGLYLSNKNRPIIQEDDQEFLNTLQQRPNKAKKKTTSFDRKRKIAPFQTQSQNLQQEPMFEARNNQVLAEYGVFGNDLGDQAAQNQASADTKSILGQIFLQNTIVYGHSLGGMYVYNTLTIIDFESVFMQKNHEYAIYVPESEMRSLIHLFVRSMHDSVHGAGTGKSMAKKMSIIQDKRMMAKTSNSKDDSSDRLLGYFQKFLNSFEEVDVDQKVLGKMGGPWGKITALMPQESLLQQIKRSTSAFKNNTCLARKEKERSRSQTNNQNACCLPFKLCFKN